MVDISVGIIGDHNIPLIFESRFESPFNSNISNFGEAWKPKTLLWFPAIINWSSGYQAANKLSSSSSGEI